MFQLIIAVALITGANLIHHRIPKPVVEVSRQKAAFNFNNKIVYFNFGLKRFISSLFWVETALNSDTEHYKKKDLNSWMYLRFDTILKLDPKFLRVYRFGGQYLSIVKDDIIGAKDIYDRGLVAYPDDYYLNYYAGFHYYHDLKDIKKTIELYQKAARDPKAPVFLSSTVAKLMNSQGYDPQEAIMLLVHAYYQMTDLEMKEVYRTKIKELGGDTTVLLK